MMKSIITALYAVQKLAGRLVAKAEAVDRRHSSATSARLRRLVTSADKQSDDELCDYLESLVQARATLHTQLSDVTQQSVKKLGLINDEARRKAMKTRLYASILPHEMCEMYTKSGRYAPVTGCVSFRQLLAMRSARSQAGAINHEWKLNNKVKASTFVEKLGVAVPKQYGSFKWEDLPDLTGKAVKPLSGAGAQGVYLVGNDKVFDVQKREVLPSRKDLDRRARALRKSKWVVEELVSQSSGEPLPARDLKFYTFYGKVALVLEVARYPEVRYCWWDGDMTPVNTGKYADTLFEGEGFTPEDRATAERISLAIPAPFCRIDLLKGHEKTVFGEITPRPGSFQDFDREMDYQLGREFILAESRLQQDLIKGAQFRPVFRK